jgi:hypothetical protein
MESILTSFQSWFIDPAETSEEVKEAIGKQCKKFVENGA